MKNKLVIFSIAILLIIIHYSAIKSIFVKEPVLQDPKISHNAKLLAEWDKELHRLDSILCVLEETLPEPLEPKKAKKINRIKNFTLLDTTHSFTYVLNGQLRVDLPWYKHKLIIDRLLDL